MIYKHYGKLIALLIAQMIQKFQSLDSLPQAKLLIAQMIQKFAITCGLAFIGLLIAQMIQKSKL